MGACASKQKVLKEEGVDAPVTREIGPIETEANAAGAGETAAAEDEAAETPAAAGGDCDEGENRRQSLEVLLKEQADARGEEEEEAAAAAAISLEKTMAAAEHSNAAALAEDKAAVMMETKDSEQPAEKVKLDTVDPVAIRSEEALPVDGVEKPAASCENPEQAVDKFIVETESIPTAAAAKEESKKPDTSAAGTA